MYFSAGSSIRQPQLLTGALALLVAASLALAGCDSGGGMGGDDDETGPPANVQVAFADDASFVVDSTVAVTATVTDAEERAVDQAVVRWSVQNGKGTIEPDTTTTDEDGTAETQWILGPNATGGDAQSLRASVGKGRVTATEAVNVNPGPIASFSLELETDTIAVDSTTTVTVGDLRDGNGNPISDPSNYTFSWTSLTPDTASVEPQSPSSSARITGVADGPAQIRVSSGAASTAGLDAVKGTAGAAADTTRVEVLRHELRGVWLTNVDSNVLDSRANIEEAMAFLDRFNFNVVFPVVWNQAATMYPSTVMDTLIGRRIDPEYEGRDPLQELIEEAHARDIAVIPWFEYGFAASFSSGGGPILDEKPGWAAKDRDGNLLEKNGFEWMNPYKPAVRDFMMGLIMEVVKNYDVDGIQGDDRLPAQPVEGGYSEFTKEQYRKDKGQDPPANDGNAEWMEWRAKILNDFGQRVYDEVKAVDEDLIVSWSPSVWRFSYREYLQDWPTWINDGYTDLIHPQVYRRDVGAYRATLDAQAADRVGWQENQLIGFYPGILLKVGGYVATPEDIKAMVKANRARGYNGEVYFFFEGFREFDADVAKALKDSYYEDPAPLPFNRASAN